jgi:rhamnogalacturonan endolyase
MEKLGRGVVAVHYQQGKIFVGWRLLATDPEDIAFNVYRKSANLAAVKLNSIPIVSATSLVDDQADLSKDNSYFVKPVLKGREQPASNAFKLRSSPPVRQYLSVPLQTPDGYTPNDISPGDLDGDGEYELVVHQVGRGRDNSQPGLTTEPILEAYKLDGTRLWRINLGRNIREGAHYTQFMVYDLDGDGKAEVACKTADGTIDGKGKVIGDAKADYRQPEGATVTVKNRNGIEQKRDVSGFVLAGPEYLTIFDGQTGAALATTNYVPPRHRECVVEG